MITISGRQLVSAKLVTVSPLDYPWRTIFYLFLIIIFVSYSFQLLTNFSRGVTLGLPKSGLPILKIFPGKVKFNPKYKLQHYNHPTTTDFLGFLLLATAAFLLIIMFKAFEYSFI